MEVRSVKFDKVKNYYNNGNGLWSKKMVKNAVGRWITTAEYKLITGEDYKSEVI